MRHLLLRIHRKRLKELAMVEQLTRAGMEEGATPTSGSWGKVFIVEKEWKCLDGCHGKWNARNVNR